MLDRRELRVLRAFGFQAEFRVGTGRVRMAQKKVELRSARCPGHLRTFFGVQ